MSAMSAMSALTSSHIIFNANKIMTNPVLLQQHMWKTKPCRFGAECKHELSECAGAHFLEEYRVPICLFLHACNKKDCSMYHPNLGTGQQYITYMGIDKILPTHQKWIADKTRREMVIKGAKHTISNPDLLREHLMKTRPCYHGLKCKNKESCSGAHFLDEYRVPICLYLEFCQEKMCKAFHPHSGKTKEQFMEENNIKLPIRNLRNKQDMMPLSEPNPLSQYKTQTSSKTNTMLCSFVKENSKCKRAGCTFAHSIEDLVLPIAQGVSLEKKREMAEKIMKKNIPSFFMKPSYMNSEYIGMMKKQQELVDELRREENGEEVEESGENIEDEKNIEEILQEIEYENAKEEFLQDLQMHFDLEELNEFEEFHFDKESDDKDDKDEDSDDEDIKVKIVVNSISKLEEMEKWGKMKTEKGEKFWGDDDDDKW